MSAASGREWQPSQWPKELPSAWHSLLMASDVAQFIAVGLALDFVLFRGTEIGWLLRVASVGVLLFAIARSHVWLLLLTIQVGLLVREPGRASWADSWESFWVCLAGLGLVAYASSFQMTRRHLSHLLASKLRWLIAAQEGDIPNEGRKEASERPTGDRLTSDRPAGGRATVERATVERLPERLGWLLVQRGLLLAIVVLISMLVFSQLPVSYVARQQWWQRSVASDLVLWPGPTMFILALGLAVLFWQSDWRQLTPAQARMVLRSALVSTLYRDLKMIVLRRLKFRKKEQQA